MRRLFMLIVTVLALVAVACSGSSDDNSSSKTSTPTTQPGAPSNKTKTWTSAPAMKIDANKTYTATIKTDKGDIVVELNAKAAPITTNNFVFLAREGFYDGLVFHRVEPGFVIQGGDPNGDGRGGPGYTIPDEKSGISHETGVIAMAKTNQPNSAGSQYYITLGAATFLDANYTAFGKVTKGMDVVQKIAKQDKMTKVTIEEK